MRDAENDVLPDVRMKIDTNCTRLIVDTCQARRVVPYSADEVSGRTQPTTPICSDQRNPNQSNLDIPGSFMSTSPISLRLATGGCFTNSNHGEAFVDLGNGCLAIPISYGRSVRSHAAVPNISW